MAPDPDSPATAHFPVLLRGARASLVGLIVNVLLVAGKLTAGLLGHSYALVADAVESSLDVFGSFVVWRGLRIAAVPADDKHPYGHGRAEPLAGIIVAMMLFVAGVGITAGAVHELFTPAEVPEAYTLVVLLAVVAIKEGMYRYAGRVARQTGSATVNIDAWHHRSDAITSLAAALGISVALVGGPRYAHADELAALVAAAIIVLNAWLLARQPLGDLMDTHRPQVADRSRSVAESVPGVAAVEKIRTRKTGLRYLIDMHVEVDPAMPVREAHAVAHDVKDAVCRAMPDVQDVLVHLEPHRRDNAAGI